MTLLELVQRFCRRQGLKYPAQVATSTEELVLQILELLNEELDDITQRQTWQGLAYETTWTTVATESQGQLATLAPHGFVSVINSTLWDRTQQVPFVLAGAAEAWQYLKALGFTGPFSEYRIRGNELLMIPVPSAGNTGAFEYRSNLAVLDVDGTTRKRYFAADDDTPILQDSLMLAGLRWRWKREKGLDYGEDFRRYEELVANAAGRDGTKPVLDMGGRVKPIQPGIFVPVGSWNVP